jgi:hypothetical protein
MYTDALSKQLGAVITQGNKPIAFFSRKLTEKQQCYSVTKIDLLAIVNTLKEFNDMLWEQRIKGFHRPKNLIQKALRLTSDHIFSGGLLLEELSPKNNHAHQRYPEYCCLGHL